MVELGMAIALGKPTFLFRDDFRRATDSEEYPLNLMLFTGIPEENWQGLLLHDIGRNHRPGQSPGSMGCRMLKTRFTELLGLQYPVMSAPMSNHSGGRLAAAVSRAGGLGTFGGSNNFGPDWFREQIAFIRAQTDRALWRGIHHSID